MTPASPAPISKSVSTPVASTTAATSVLLSMTAAFLAAAVQRARRHPRDVLPGRDIVRHHGARARHRAPADAYRRHKHRAAADECAVLDDRLVLGCAVIVARDRTRADVDLCADLRVADIAEVAGLRPTPDPRGLHLDEVAKVDA